MWNANANPCNLINQGHDNVGPIFQMLQVLTLEDAELFYCVLWSIWKQWNNKIWNDVVDV